MKTTTRGRSVRLLLLGVGLFALSLPLAAIFLLDLFAGFLVRATERELAAESALIAELYLDHLRPNQRGEGAPAAVRPPDARDPQFSPLVPQVDLRAELVPTEPPPKRRRLEPERPAAKAGLAVDPILNRVKRVNLSGVRLLDEQGCVVASTSKRLGDCLDELPEVAKALKGRYAAVVRWRTSKDTPPLSGISRRGTVRVFTATPVFDQGQVVGVVRLSRTAESPLEALYRERALLLWLSVGCLALVLGVSLTLARWLIRPVRALTRAAQDIARGEERVPLRAGGRLPAELFDLSLALDQMKAQLNQRAVYAAEFAADVGHELKTPLAAIRGAVELLEEEEMSAEERARFLRNVAEDAARMERLVASILRLARLENAAKAKAEPLSLVPVLERLAARSPRVSVVVKPDAPPALAIEAEHLESALLNLLENALRHSEGPVELGLGREGARALLWVKDLGPGIPEAFRPRLFKRFATTRREEGGTGLGLAIVAAVAQARGGEVRCETGPAGTTFVLVLPV